MKIEISIKGGVVVGVEKLPNYISPEWGSEDAEVEIRDYDVEGMDEERISKDESGEECAISTW